MKPSGKRTIEYLNKNIRQSIENDIIKISRVHDIYEGGYLSIPRSVFCCVDYLGYIAFGYTNNNSNKIEDIRHTECI